MGYWFSRLVTLEPVGDWTLTLGLNNGAYAIVPFKVVSTPPTSRTAHRCNRKRCRSNTPPRTRDATTCRVTPVELFRQIPTTTGALLLCGGSPAPSCATTCGAVRHGAPQHAAAWSDAVVPVTPSDGVGRAIAVVVSGAAVRRSDAERRAHSGSRAVIELQTRINALRSRWGLASYAFSAITAGVTISANHIVQLRSALNDVYVTTNITPGRSTSMPPRLPACPFAPPHHELRPPSAVWRRAAFARHSNQRRFTRLATAVATTTSRSAAVVHPNEQALGAAPVMRCRCFRLPNRDRRHHDRRTPPQWSVARQIEMGAVRSRTCRRHCCGNTGPAGGEAVPPRNGPALGR